MQAYRSPHGQALVGRTAAAKEQEGSQERWEALTERRAIERRSQQSPSPPLEPETPSPEPAHDAHGGRGGSGTGAGTGADAGEGGGGGGGGGRYAGVRGDRRQATTISLPPEMAGMVIPEGADGPAPTNLAPCQLCGRNFVPKALAIHSRICAKVFATKRKQFDSQGARADGTELAQFQRENGGGAGSPS